jgi:assimilatory nitrate reductase catalytic subunit
MTRTGLSPKLARHTPDPFVEVNPDDASKLGLNADGFARVSTADGSAVLRVKITAAQVPGRIFAPIHWNDETAARRALARLCILSPTLIQGSRTPRPFRRRWPGFFTPCTVLFFRARAGDTVFAWNAIEGGYAARFATNEPFAGLFEA